MKETGKKQKEIGQLSRLRISFATESRRSTALRKYPGIRDAARRLTGKALAQTCLNIIGMY